MTKKELKPITDRNMAERREFKENMNNYIFLSQEQSKVTVKILVTSADISANPSDYVSTSVNQPRLIATFSTKEEAELAVSSNDFSGAQSLMTYTYPAKDKTYIVETI